MKEITTNDILIELYNTNWLIKQCFFITKDPNNADFLCSEVMIKIIENDSPKLIKLYNENKHLNYIYTMIKNEWISKYSNTGKFIKNINEIPLILKYD